MKEKELEEYEIVCGVCEEPIGVKGGVLIGEDNLLIHKECVENFEE